MKQEAEQIAAEQTSTADNMGILGNSPLIRQIRDTILQVAATHIPVLIEGESGTGKELVAAALHANSPQRTKIMFTVNCGAIPEGILESELFGHQRGAFTGAVDSRKGYFELADGSTLFLDEVGEMPLTTQVKVLRILEQKEFMRIGGSSYHQVDVRVIAATNKSLADEVHAGRFRQDLYFRLNVVKIVVPTLRDRKEDIPLLISQFAREFCLENYIKFAGFSAEAVQLLQAQPWPGNVRELRNLVQSVILLEKGDKITPEILYRYLHVGDAEQRRLPVPTSISAEQAERELIYRLLLELKADMSQIKQLLFSQFVQPKSLQPWREYADTRPLQQFEEIKLDDDTKTLAEMERELILRTLEKTNWSKRKTAKILGISERTLYRKIDEYKLQSKFQS